MEFPPELTRIFPKFDVIFLVFSEKLPKFTKDDRYVDLIWIGLGIKYLLSHMNGVGNDNDFRDVCFVASLINTASNNKKFCFCASDKDCVMNRFDQRLITYVDMQDQSGDVVLDASIGNYNCHVWRHGRLNSHII